MVGHALCSGGTSQARPKSERIPGAALTPHREPGRLIAHDAVASAGAVERIAGRAGTAVTTRRAKSPSHVTAAATETPAPTRSPTPNAAATATMASATATASATSRDHA